MSAPKIKVSDHPGEEPYVQLLFKDVTDKRTVRFAEDVLTDLGRLLYPHGKVTVRHVYDPTELADVVFVRPARKVPVTEWEPGAR